MFEALISIYLDCAWSPKSEATGADVCRGTKRRPTSYPGSNSALPNWLDLDGGQKNKKLARNCEIIYWVQLFYCFPEKNKHNKFVSGLRLHKPFQENTGLENWRFAQIFLGANCEVRKLIFLCLAKLFQYYYLPNCE